MSMRDKHDNDMLKAMKSIAKSLEVIAADVEQKRRLEQNYVDAINAVGNVYPVSPDGIIETMNAEPEGGKCDDR